jgi:intracellular septation protein
LGGISLLESDPLFFKLQPAILCFAFAGFLLGSTMIGKPMLVEMMKKQRPDAPPEAFAMAGGMNFRVGLCMIVVGVIGVHAAYYWSTAAWATYKGVGVPIIILVYMLGEVAVARARRKRPPPSV